MNLKTCLYGMGIELNWFEILITCSISIALNTNSIRFVIGIGFLVSINSNEPHRYDCFISFERRTDGNWILMKSILMIFQYENFISHAPNYLVCFLFIYSSSFLYCTEKFELKIFSELISKARYPCQHQTKWNSKHSFRSTMLLYPRHNKWKYWFFLLIFGVSQSWKPARHITVDFYLFHFVWPVLFSRSISFWNKNVCVCADNIQPN